MPRKPTIAAILCFCAVSTARAASWKGIEPLKARPADVLRILGKPASENAAEASMKFSTNEGVATVSYVKPEFAANKRWDKSLEGTVVSILIEHTNSKETPKSLGLEGNSSFVRQERGETVFFRNRKEGIIRVFKNGKLAMTVYSPADGGPGEMD